MFLQTINSFMFNRDFLPRGSGIVTRRPLILQLIFSNTGKMHNMKGVYFEKILVYVLLEKVFDKVLCMIQAIVLLCLCLGIPK